jgi:hypothetical protein
VLCKGKHLLFGQTALSYAIFKRDHVRTRSPHDGSFSTSSAGMLRGIVSTTSTPYHTMERELVKLHRVTAKGLPAPASGLAESGEMLDAHREVAF